MKFFDLVFSYFCLFVCFYFKFFVFLFCFVFYFFFLFLMFWEERDIKGEQKHIFALIFNKGRLQSPNDTKLRWVK